ncbi:hypothetical protein ACFRQM_44065 [Streptomyces sp. NPDC056831]|uniref:hypothetical protein n=1 Tax=Streptomyces sp. NPDC056831 TaxID=3345954 RepID=UPI0036790644
MESTPRPGPGLFGADAMTLRRSVVPYIASWSPERVPSPVVISPRGGIAYPDEDTCDRDGKGRLWLRTLIKPRCGRPELGRVHPLRQRRAMNRMLCQVCGGPSDRDERGTLWLLEDCREDWEGWPNGLLTVHPPVCVPCARIAVGACPNLLYGSVAVRVGSSEVAGVYGVTYQPGKRKGSRVVEDGDPASRWVLASQLALSLSDCTLIDLDEITDAPTPPS